MNSKTVAVLLAAGQGKRMNSDVHKQYLLIRQKPVLYYSLKELEESFVDTIVLVVGKEEATYCREQIIEQYGFRKVKRIVEGGRERYHSVWNGLCAVKDLQEEYRYVMIHDGARPFLTPEILQRCLEEVQKSHACAAGMKSKDTVKITDRQNYCKETPDRNDVWIVQTPQSFAMSLIWGAYSRLMESERKMGGTEIKVTDDAMVVETFTDHKVKMIEGSYQNIKITTPEDLKIAEAFLAF